MVEKKTNYLLCFIFALLGALIGALPWGIVGYFGWFVGWLGYVIGFCAKKGYEIAGGKKNYIEIAIIVVTTIIGVLFGQILVNLIYLLVNIDDILYGDYTLVPSAIIRLFSYPDFVADFLKNSLIGMLFGYLGIRSIIREIKNDINTQPELIEPELVEEPVLEVSETNSEI